MCVGVDFSESAHFIGSIHLHHVLQLRLQLPVLSYKLMKLATPPLDNHVAQGSQTLSVAAPIDWVRMEQPPSQQRWNS